jgi:hypothetical protein
MNINKLEKLILDNQDVSVHEILQVNNSIGSVEAIIHKHLRFQKVSVGWVPKMLIQM